MFLAFVVNRKADYATMTASWLFLGLCALPIVDARSDVAVSRTSSCADVGSCSQSQARTLLQHARGLGEQSTSTDMQTDAKTDQDPEGSTIKDYIENTLLPTEEQTKAELQEEASRAERAFEGCSVELTTIQENLRNQEQTLITAEQRHNECEMKVEMTNRTEEEVCNGLNTFATKLEAPLDFSTVNSSDTAALIGALNVMNDYFNDVYPSLKRQKQQCDLAKNDEVVSQEQCDADKKSIEASYCSLKAARVRSCSDFDTCFTSKSKRFDEVIAYVKQGEELSKANFKTLACHGDKDCTSTESDTAHLSVSYPTKPAKQECIAEVKTNWEYDGVECS